MAALETPTAAMASLLEKLKLEDPWVPPRSWDSLTSLTVSSALPSSLASSAFYTNYAVSEHSLVRLAMNALHGVESALMSIEKLSLLLSYSSADRTSHRIPSLWTWCSSTSAIGNLLTSIGQFGCIVFYLHIFANYFASPDVDELRGFEQSRDSDSSEEGKSSGHKHTLINQAFAVCVRKILDGYKSALNTLSASVSLRRASKTNDGECLTSVTYSEITLLEVYLHTTGITTQIEALGNICNVNHVALSFPVSSLEELKINVNSELRAFPRGADLLSFLYSQLQVADSNHRALLKFLFLRSYEPYCGFIRSWIYDGRISDPYKEFVVEYASDDPIYATDVEMTSALPIVKIRDEVPVPCFLKECLIPLCRTGQQLQVLKKLLELCKNVGTYDAHEAILPCLIGLSNAYPWFAYPLAFDKGTIETIVLARAIYYQEMLEKIDEKLAKFSFHQATPLGITQKIGGKIEKNVNYRASSVDGNRIPLLSGGRSQNMPDCTVDSEVASILDECTYGEDLLESSECSSSETPEEENADEQLLHAAKNKVSCYLDALDLSSSFSPDYKVPNLYTSEVSCSVEDDLFKIDETSCCSMHPFYKETNPLGTEPKFSKTIETQIPSGAYSRWLFDVHHIDRRVDGNAWLPSHGCGLELSLRNCKLLNTDSNLFENTSKVDISMSSQTCSVLPWKHKYDSSFFSMNPRQDKSSFFNLRTMNGGDDSDYVLTYFDFASVKDPLKEYTDKLSGCTVLNLGNDLSVVSEAAESCLDINNHHNIDNHRDTDTRNNDESCNVFPPLLKKESDLLPNLSVCGSWESLLGRFGNVTNRSQKDHRTTLVAATEMPLDFVIKQCLLDEILLQYRYLSKLTIKLLVERFKLQEHLLALRRYHFMEFADWADMFIASLWRRKWHVNEADKRIPEIQGFLELSVRRSSCEGDPNKDRLYVYLKDEGLLHLLASTSGINSFDFLGLGYRVDWPVSIILTPTALKIYSEIFSFLMRLKLAVFSLSDAWLSLKNHCVEQHKGEALCFSILTDTRHKISHFVSALQQYVQSQLSHVSWCRFLHSLQHKVEDMLDLESVHMLYLTEALHICFLSKDSQSIARIIRKILQCAMDYRSCLTGRIWEAGSCDEKLSNIFSEIDVSQVCSIRRTFTENLEELHLLYLQSPKHGEFSISDFWDYLNYNEYYADAINKRRGHSIF